MDICRQTTELVQACIFRIGPDAFYLFSSWVAEYPNWMLLEWLVFLLIAQAPRNTSAIWSIGLKLAKIRLKGNNCALLCWKAIGSCLLSSLICISVWVGNKVSIPWVRPEVKQSFYKSSVFCSSRDFLERLYSCRMSGI
jgi:hypothetical protein